MQSALVTSWSSVSSSGVGGPGLSDFGAIEQNRAEGLLRATELEDHPALAGRSTRTVDRWTRLALVPSSLVLQGAGIPEDELERVGVVMGSSTGSVESITSLLKDSFTQSRPYHVDPAQFPNTVMNAAAGQIAIWLGLGGPNVSVAAGQGSSLAALRYALRLLRHRHAPHVLAGGVEELSQPVIDAWRAACRSDSLTQRGTLGEGSCMFLLEASDDDRPGIRLRGFTECHARFPVTRDSIRAGLRSAVLALLERHELAPEDVRGVSLSHGADAPLAQVEIEVCLQVLGERVPRLDVASHLGDTYSASGAFQLAQLCQMRDEGQLRGPVILLSTDRDGSSRCALVSLS